MILKDRKILEMPVWYITITDKIYEQILANGADKIDWEFIGIDINKHSWHTAQDKDFDGIIINVLVAEAFGELAEGDFLQLRIAESFLE